MFLCCILNKPWFKKKKLYWRLKPKTRSPSCVLVPLETLDVLHSLVDQIIACLLQQAFSLSAFSWADHFSPPFLSGVSFNIAVSFASSFLGLGQTALLPEWDLRSLSSWLYTWLLCLRGASLSGLLFYPPCLISLTTPFGLTIHLGKYFPVTHTNNTSICTTSVITSKCQSPLVPLNHLVFKYISGICCFKDWHLSSLPQNTLIVSLNMFWHSGFH